MKKLFLLSLAAIILIFSFPYLALAKQDFSKTQIEVTPVRKNIYMLHGAGGNIGILSGQDGVFMIDDQYAPLSQKITTAIQTINKKPIRFLLNTHWHGDHTGGNEHFGKSGVTIVAHDNVRKLMSAPQEIRLFKMKSKAASKEALPVVTFNDTTTFHLNKETIKVSHFPAAHSSGDSYIHFKNTNVIHTGDLYFNGFYPFIDVAHGGSIDGMIKATQEIISIANYRTKIIPGHGPLSNKKELIAFNKMLKDVRELAIAAIKNNQSAEQLAVSDSFSKIHKKWGGGFINSTNFLEIVYSSLESNKYP